MIVYWDSSALLSGLFRDAHSNDAVAWSRREGYHLLSSLAWAEVTAVMARMRRERLATDIFIDSALQAIAQGPWRRLNITPRWQAMEGLSRKWPLRGADLWHLAAAMTLRDDRPELMLLTYDGRLRAAAAGEGFAAA
jgi:predicted nucleic acid-binding protein